MAPRYRIGVGRGRHKQQFNSADLPRQPAADFPPVECAVCRCAPDDDPCGCACHDGERFGVDEKGRRYDTPHRRDRCLST